MIRVGTSWRGGHGNRHYVSGPLWLAALGGWMLWPFSLVAWMFWLFIGWWLALGIAGLILPLWLLAQLILILVSAGGMAWATWSNARKGTHYRGRILNLPFWLFAVEQTTR
jgi:hypothetical protein